MSKYYLNYINLTPFCFAISAISGSSCGLASPLFQAEEGGMSEPLGRTTNHRRFASSPAGIELTSGAAFETSKKIGKKRRTK
jgi:hypothetical protein